MKEKDKGALRITNQFREKGGMVYEMRFEGVRLSVSISQRKMETDLGEWRVEARAARPTEPEHAFEAWGPTKLDALHAVAKTWTEKAPADLPTFDWELVAKVLGEVAAV